MSDRTTRSRLDALSRRLGLTTALKDQQQVDRVRRLVAEETGQTIEQVAADASQWTSSGEMFAEMAVMGVTRGEIIAEAERLIRDAQVRYGTR
jgi:hypothetical protein